MHYHKIIPALLVSICPLLATAEDAQSILETMQEKQVERSEGVNAYVVVQSVMGQKLRLSYERIELKAADGTTYPAFAPVRGNATNASSSALMGSYADGLETTGDALSNGVQDGLENAGLPGGLFKGMGGDPWASMDPGVMMGSMAKFSRAAGQAKPDEAELDAARRREGIGAFADQARLLGTEKVDGHPAFHLIAEDLNQVQQADGEEFELQTLDLWIDAVEYVPLRTKVSGIARSAGEARAITIEKFDSDYRQVEGSRMYEPYRQVMRLAGMMSAEQLKEMQGAQQQMADLEAQLAQMPPAQRKMIASQMGPQIQMMKSMASGGGMEIVMEVQQIVVNPNNATPKFSTGIAVLQAAPAALPLAPATLEVLPSTQKCLGREAVLRAEKARKTKRGFGRLLGATSRVASRFGKLAVIQVVDDVYTADATTADVTAAAKDLGLAQDPAVECEGPASTNGNQG